MLGDHYSITSSARTKIEVSTGRTTTAATQHWWSTWYPASIHFVERGTLFIACGSNAGSRRRHVVTGSVYQFPGALLAGDSDRLTSGFKAYCGSRHRPGGRIRLVGCTTSLHSKFIDLDYRCDECGAEVLRAVPRGR